MKIVSAVGGFIGGYIKTVDKWLMTICIVLSLTSVYYLYGIYYIGFARSNSRAETQGVAALIGVVCVVIISLIDYKTLLKAWVVYLPLCIIAVGLTFFIGVQRGSNQAWLSVPVFGRSVSIQPSEFLKISFITTFALHLNYVKEQINKLKNVVLLCLHAGGYILLIVLQRDDGTAIVFFGIFVIMMFTAGLSWKYILPSIALIGVTLPVLWFKVMSLDQQMRFLVLKDPSISDQYAYQQLQGLKALGNGGITGVGLSGNHVYVPESYNDFIFTFIGQVSGIVACGAVILLIVVLCVRLVYVGNRALDTTGRMICMGVFAMVLIQSIINIGMCLNILPVIGVPLPFISSGGTSVVAIYLGMGLVNSVYRHSKVGFFD